MVAIKGVEEMTNEEHSARKGKFVEIDLSAICFGYNARTQFDHDKLIDLSASIRDTGLCQPVVVRPFGNDGKSYQLIAGERRVRAAKLIPGMTHILAHVVDVTDAEALLIGLEENIQRDNLNPIEEAQAYRSLVDIGWTQQRIAEQVLHRPNAGPTVSNMIRLLELPRYIQDAILDGTISLSAGKALLSYIRWPNVFDAIAELALSGVPSKQIEKVPYKVAVKLDAAGHAKITTANQCGAACSDFRRLESGDQILCLDCKCYAEKRALRLGTNKSRVAEIIGNTVQQEPNCVSDTADSVIDAAPTVPSSEDERVVYVSADRLAQGGDIKASYSADRIAECKPIRKPFIHDGLLFVCIGGSDDFSEAYALIPAQNFNGPIVSYGDDHEAARNNPMGFYHGIAVKHNGKDYVLCGREITFRPAVESTIENAAQTEDTPADKPLSETVNVGDYIIFDDGSNNISPVARRVTDVIQLRRKLEADGRLRPLSFDDLDKYWRIATAEEIASAMPQQPTQTLSSLAAQEAASIAQVNPEPAAADGESRRIIQIELSADDMALVNELGDNAINDNPLTPEQIFALGLDRAADDNNLFRCENCRGWYSEADAIRQVDDVWLCKECAKADRLCGYVESTGMPR